MILGSIRERLGEQKIASRGDRVKGFSRGEGERERRGLVVKEALNLLEGVFLFGRLSKPWFVREKLVEGSDLLSRTAKQEGSMGGGRGGTEKCLQKRNLSNYYPWVQYV